MDPLLNHATGQLFDSKSQFRRATKAAGCVELGSDAPTTMPRRESDRAGIRNAIGQSIAELKAGRPAPQLGRAEGTYRRYE